MRWATDGRLCGTPSGPCVSRRCSSAVGLDAADAAPLSASVAAQAHWPDAHVVSACTLCMAATLRSPTGNLKTALRSRHLHPEIWICPEFKPPFPYTCPRRGVFRGFRRNCSLPLAPSSLGTGSGKDSPSLCPPPAQKASYGTCANGRARLDAPAHAVLASPTGKSSTDAGTPSRLAYLRRRIFAPRRDLCLRIGRRRARTTRSVLRSSAPFAPSDRRGLGRPDPLSSEALSFRRSQAAAHVSDAVSRSNCRADTTAPLSSGSLSRSLCAAQQTPRPDRSRPFEAPITNAHRSPCHDFSTHVAAFPFPTRLGIASAPSFRDRCASLRSLRRSPPAPVDDHGGQDRPENSQPPWNASPGPPPITRPSAPTHPRFSRLERSSVGRSTPIELVELSSPPNNNTKLFSLANEPPAIGLSADPSQTQTLVIFPTDRRQSGVECSLPSPTQARFRQTLPWPWHQNHVCSSYPRAVNNWMKYGRNTKR